MTAPAFLNNTENLEVPVPPGKAQLQKEHDILTGPSLVQVIVSTLFLQTLLVPPSEYRWYTRETWYKMV